MNVIHSCAHKIYTETINKVALSSEDDKKNYFRRWNSHSRSWTFQTYETYSLVWNRTYGAPEGTRKLKSFEWLDLHKQ